MSLWTSRFYSGTKKKKNPEQTIRKDFFPLSHYSEKKIQGYIKRKAVLWSMLFIQCAFIRICRYAHI